MKLEPCQRCGICCKIELCFMGKRNKKGCCKYLIKNNDKTTSCELILQNKMPIDKVDLGLGCIMRINYPMQFKFYSELWKYGQ